MQYQNCQISPLKILSLITSLPRLTMNITQPVLFCYIVLCEDKLQSYLVLCLLNTLYEIVLWFILCLVDVLCVKLSSSCV